MKTLGLLAIGPLLCTLGCWPMNPQAPEEEALDRFEAAKPLFEAKRYEEAAPHYEFITTARPRWKEAYVKLSCCQEALGHEEEAAATLERLLGIDRFDPEALGGLGRLYAHRGATDQALDRYRRLRELHPGDAALEGEIARLESLRSR